MFEIIHQGTLTMWRQRVNLDLWIVNHAAAQTIEIVAFRADTNKEARLYVDKLAILRKIDYQELDHTIAEEKEAHLRQHKTFVAENFVKSFEDDHIVNFIRKRLSIPANLPSDAFQLELKVLFGDRVRERAARANSFAEAGRMDTAGGGQVLEGLLDSPPTSLAPYRAKLQPKLEYVRFRSSVYPIHSLRWVGFVLFTFRPNHPVFPRVCAELSSQCARSHVSHRSLLLRATCPGQVHACGLQDRHQDRSLSPQPLCGSPPYFLSACVRQESSPWIRSPSIDRRQLHHGVHQLLDGDTDARH